MAGRQEQKLMTSVEPFLAPGERALAAIIAQPRGYSQVVGSHSVSGTGKLTESRGQAADADVQVASPMGLVLTDRRVLTLKISTAVGMGIGGSVKAVLSAIPLADVTTIEARREKIAKVTVLTVRGTPIHLESNIGANAENLAQQFLAAKQMLAG